MPRGRPRSFDEDVALNGAMMLFWEKGLSACSLDELSQAMNMNRPSIYNAFGNKDEIYRKALERFCMQLDQAMEQTLGTGTDLREGLIAFFDAAIGHYCGNQPAMGCLMVCTAPSAALTHPQVGEDLRALIQRVDRGIARRLRRAQKEGELAADIHPELTARLLQATLQTIALRSRAGEAKRELKRLARFAVERLTLAPA